MSRVLGQGVVRRRLEELRMKVRTRAPFRGQIQIGGGVLIRNAMNTVNNILDRATAKIQQLKPGIIPLVRERVERMKVGQRIREIVTPKGVPYTPRTTTPPPETKPTASAFKLRG